MATDIPMWPIKHFADDNYLLLNESEFAASGFATYSEQQNEIM